MLIRIQGENYYPKTMVFSGGEVNVTLPSVLPYEITDYAIKVKIKSSQDLIELLMVKDALDRKYVSMPVCSGLAIPYLPYARQDRVCNPGEALSIKVLANLINSMNFDVVETFDNHSDVSTALINNCWNYSAAHLMDRSESINNILTKPDVVLCSPDAGATKKTYEIAKRFGGLRILHADKIRNTKTGEITSTEVYCGALEGQDVFIADDICDGGMTFIKLAEALKAKGAGDLYLYVTHGIFSKGLEPLSAYKKIFTTDSLRSAEDKTDVLEVIKI